MSSAMSDLNVNESMDKLLNVMTFSVFIDFKVAMVDCFLQCSILITYHVRVFLKAAKPTKKNETIPMKWIAMVIKRGRSHSAIRTELAGFILLIPGLGSASDATIFFQSF